MASRAGPSAAPKIVVRFFASAREAAGCEVTELAWREGLDVGAVADHLVATMPRLAGLQPRCLLAVNQELAARGLKVAAGDEIAVLPPVSGGMQSPAVLVRVDADPISVDALIAHVAHAGAGAIATFLGTVRDHNAGRRVHYLEYEGFVPMAVRELERIAVEVLERWPDARVAVHHRLGRLELGEASVGIAVATGHRGAAFDACRQVIEALKVRVPIWKKEHFAGGTVWIETAADRPAAAGEPAP